MVAQPNRIVIAVADYLKLPDDGNRYEVYEGEIHQMPPSPNLAHQRIVRRLLGVLDSHVEQRKLGEVFVAPLDVILSDFTVVQPDLIFVSNARQEIVLSQHIRGAPDLVVEVVSPSSERRDREIKAQLYARLGVPHYWLVDPQREEAAAYELHAGGYRVAVVARGGSSFAAKPFADLAIQLTLLWE
jgi:Uma2 family endonuclease